MNQHSTCYDLRKLGDAVVEQGKQMFTSLRKYDFLDCLDFLGSREGYSKELIEHLAVLAKQVMFVSRWQELDWFSILRIV
jgi:hypothetical protein